MPKIRFHRFVLCLTLTLLTACANPSNPVGIHGGATPVSSVGVSELNLREMFKVPVGPQGLEPTEKLLSLKDKRVRVIGHMVHEQEPTPGIFMLSPLPVGLAEKEDGPADDLPAATLFVHMPSADANKLMAFRPGLWTLTGKLDLGSREEDNGRVSYVRLLLDQIPGTEGSAN
ncbi:MAG: hypothetical protein PHE55_09450 [Methylococcaceae bacterium]|nr:hypothetical protein [Methylococcaceae bacterium]